MEPFLLSHSLIGDREAPSLAFVLHGALGSQQNWRGFVRQLQREVPSVCFALVDLRDHGGSRGAPPPHTMQTAADDLAVLAETLGRAPDVVLGHSLAGKVALVYARDHGAQLRQVWTLDSTLGRLELDETGHEVLEVLRLVRSLPMPLARREDVVPALESRGVSPTLARWMTTNLVASPAGYEWTFDLDGVEALLLDYFDQDLWPFVESWRVSPEVHVLMAEDSDRFFPETLERLRALPPETHTHAHLLPNSGHWVQVDNPRGLSEILRRAL